MNRNIKLAQDLLQETNRQISIIDEFINSYDPYNIDHIPFIDHYNNIKNNLINKQTEWSDNVAYLTPLIPDYEQDILDYYYFNLSNILKYTNNPDIFNYSSINIIKYIIDEINNNPVFDQKFRTDLLGINKTDLLIYLKDIINTIPTPTLPRYLIVEYAELYKAYKYRPTLVNPVAPYSNIASDVYGLSSTLYASIMNTYNSCTDFTNPPCSTAFEFIQRYKTNLSPYNNLTIADITSDTTHFFYTKNYEVYSFLDVARLPVQDDFGAGLTTTIYEFFLYILAFKHPTHVSEILSIPDNYYFTGFAIPKNEYIHNIPIKVLIPCTHPTPYPEHKPNTPPYRVNIDSINPITKIPVYYVDVNIDDGYEEIIGV